MGGVGSAPLWGGGCVFARCSRLHGGRQGGFTLTPTARHFAVSVRALPTGSTTHANQQSRSAGPAQSSGVPQPSLCPWMAL